MTKALKITTANQVETIELDDLAGYQKAVGGFIEAIPLGDDHALVINEEGKLARLPRNVLATLIAFNFRSGIASNDYIVGDAVIVGNPADSGEWTDYQDKLAEEVRAIAATL